MFQRLEAELTLPDIDAIPFEPWSERDITDLRRQIARGRTVAETASFLYRDEDEVRTKVRALELEEHPEPWSESYITDPTQKIARSRTVAEIANVLCRVREKVKALGREGRPGKMSRDRPRMNSSKRIGPLATFFVKTVIISAAVVLSAWVLLGVLDGFATRRMQQLEQTIRTATSLGGTQFWTKLEGELDKLADGRTDIPPEKKAKILSQIKAVSDRWRPFLTDAAAAVEGEEKKPAN